MLQGGQLDNFPQSITDENGTTFRGNDTVVESWHNTDYTQWYRIWASGFKECGVSASNASSNSYIITTPISFINTSSYIVVVGYAAIDYYSTVRVERRSANTFAVWQGKSGNTTTGTSCTYTTYCCGW